MHSLFSGASTTADILIELGTLALGLLIAAALKVGVDAWLRHRRARKAGPPPTP